MLMDPDFRPPPTGPKMDFWTPLNAKPEPIVIISPRMHAHAIHYDARTLPCTLRLDKEGNVLTACKICSDGQRPRRWRGYFFVLRIHSHSYEFLCLTPGCGSALLEKHGEDFDYRGCMARVHRVAGQRNKPLIVELDTYLDRRTQIPADVDPGPYLDIVFRRTGPLKRS